MSNTHGRLPKAERAQLPTELHQRLAVWTTKAYPDEGAIPTFRLACEMRGKPELNAQQS